MKFIIKETQIDNYNDTHNQLNTFSEGLNIIFGKNEIGKSTLMNFIKNILIKTSDAKGYIKCEKNGEEFNLRAEKKFKENNLYLDKINPNLYKDGFIITLDDIVYSSKKDSQTLVDTIRDSSGEGVKIKEKELHDFIDSYIKIKSKGASSKLTPYFESICNINTKIKDLQQYEELYNDICVKLETLQSNINLLKAKQNCIEILLKKDKLKQNINHIIINKKLIDNKDFFEKIKDNFSVLIRENSLKNDFSKDIELKKEEYNKTKKELDKIEFFTEDDLEKFILDREKIKLADKILEEEKDLIKEEDFLLKDIENIENTIREIQAEKEIKNQKIKEQGIENIKEYTSDKILLESYCSTYNELNYKAKNNEVLNSKDNYSISMIIIFLMILFVTIGMWINYKDNINNILFIGLSIISISGIATGGFNFFKNKKIKSELSYKNDLDNIEKNAIKLCNKYETIIDKTNLISQLNKQLLVMNEKITKYENILNELDNLRKTIIKLENDKETKLSSLKEIRDKKTENNLRKENFLSETNIKNIESYSEIYEKIKELLELKNAIAEGKERISLIEKNNENFIKILDEFIKNSDLNEINTIMTSDFNNLEKILNEIKDIIVQETKKDTIIESYSKEIVSLEEIIKEYPVNLLTELKDLSEDSLNNIKKELEEVTREYGRKEQEKQALEKVSGLIKLKNKKNIRISETKEFLKNLFIKEMLYNIILCAKEKFNESQPNLMSARNYLSKITCGKYDNIDFENKTISGKNIGEKDWDKLSRGTKEQLYLALRLGFAGNFSKDINGKSNDLPNMPLIIDDAFVNFDKTRTGEILKCLEEFSHTNQVLFFTCHTESIKNILKKEKISYNEINLD